jgi:hypothetical protein
VFEVEKLGRVGSLILRLVGALLLVAAGLKGYQAVTEPMAGSDIWTNRNFLILTVELELAMGIWLVSGLFKKLAWLAGVFAFVGFSGVTLYKGLTGAESCGCFGPVHVNPWITLFAIDIPVVIVLAIFRPRGGKWLYDFSMAHFATTACAVLLVTGVTTPVLALNEPAKVTSAYEVLEPETWLGQELPIMEYIDIREKLKKGNWLILLYHYDCPDCQKAIVQYEQMASDIKGNEDFLQIALIEIPPYGHGPSSENTPCTIGKLAAVKEWFATTPSVVLLTHGKVTSAWEAVAPGFKELYDLTTMNYQTGWFSYFVLELPTNNIQNFDKGGEVKIKVL